jgi:hypothetical protein
LPAAASEVRRVETDARQQERDPLGAPSGGHRRAQRAQGFRNDLGDSHGRIEARERILEHDLRTIAQAAQFLAGQILDRATQPDDLAIDAFAERQQRA